MHQILAPDLFARVMALPRADREDLLEFIGGASIDEDRVSHLIDEIAARIEADRNPRSGPN